MQPLGHVRDAQDIFRLPGDPGAGHHLVVETDDDGPFSGDFAQTIDHAGGAFFVLAWDHKAYGGDTRCPDPTGIPAAAKRSSRRAR